MSFTETEKGRAILPKFIKLRDLEARGVIPYTVWDFNKIELHKKRQQKAKRWLTEELPKVMERMER